MINVKELYKSFESKDVLKGISFKINHGESVAIIGKSGIGKSVLLKHLIGLIQPDSGEVWVEEKLVNTLSFTQLQSVRAQCGMVFQFGALFDSMSVEENIGLALSKLSEMNKEEVTQQISKSLAEVGMENSEKLMPSSLSGGMKKRVGIARAIAIKPKYLLYDEPTTGLDPVMTDSINRLISKIHKQEDVTSIMVTHELRTVFEVAERVIMIHDGKIK
ncbi:MAG: ATP-binding cassette domain-containing protein, partial [Candidatus Marinimicrobia bacterium]|nr:ATP-binding cassette domain-containing protein [Candidatus Neomarinimicrobiota bacterium]